MKTSLVVIFILLCTAGLAGLSLSFVLDDEGDVGIVVEKLQSREGEVIDRCPYCGKTILPGPIHSDADVVVKEKLETALTNAEVGYKGGKENRNYINVLIYRFRERQGGKYAVDQPAGVGLHMHFMHAGEIKGIFVFDEDQQPLSANVLGIGKFLKRGGKWVTVDELAGEGVNAGVAHFLKALP